VAKCLTRNISATMRDRGMVSMDHLQDFTLSYGENAESISPVLDSIPGRHTKTDRRTDKQTDRQNYDS